MRSLRLRYEKILVPLQLGRFALPAQVCLSLSVHHIAGEKGTQTFPTMMVETSLLTCRKAVKKKTKTKTYVLNNNNFIDVIFVNYLGFSMYITNHLRKIIIWFIFSK